MDRRGLVVVVGPVADRAGPIGTPACRRNSTEWDLNVGTAALSRSSGRSSRPRRRSSHCARTRRCGDSRPRAPSPAGRPVAPDPGAQGGCRPAHAHGETPPLEPRDVVAPAHHERLDPAAAVRSPHFPLPRSGQVQPERPRGADPEVTPCYHALGQKRVVRSGVAQVLSTIRGVTQTVWWARLKCLFFQ